MTSTPRPTEKKSRDGKEISLEGLPDAEDKIEPVQRLNVRRMAVGVYDTDRKDGRIQVIANVYPDRADGGAITQARPDGMGHVIEIARHESGQVPAILSVLLRHLEQPRPHVFSRGVDVTHVMKENGAQVLTHKRKRQRGCAEFDLI